MIANFRFLCLSVFFILACQKERIQVPTTQHQTNVSGRINDIYFLNETKGFAVGGNRYTEGYIFKTTDGGNTWEKVLEDSIFSTKNETLQTLNSIHFFDENIGQIVGHGGKILRTENGGDTWEIIINGTWSNFYAIQMLSPQKTFLVSSGAYASGSIFNSSDYWYYFQRDTFPFALRDIHFINDQTGFAAGYGTVQKTINGGNTWQYLDIKLDYFYDLDFPSENIGYVCGFEGSIYKTTNQGETWQKINASNTVFAPRQHYENIHFITENKGAVCGYRGEILFTQNGGETWQKIKTETKADFHSIRFADEKHLFVGGENGVLLELEVP